MSPRKVQRVASLISGMPVVRAQAELSLRGEKSAEPVAKLLRSAVANATSLTDAKPETMKVLSCSVTPGPVMKRFRPKARGTAHPYAKRMSHLTIILDVPGERHRAAAPEAPMKLEKGIKGEPTDRETPVTEEVAEQPKGGSHKQQDHSRDVARGQKRRAETGRSRGFFRRKAI